MTDLCIYYYIAEKWAKCHRCLQHADTDTNMYLERFDTHNSVIVAGYLHYNYFSFHNNLKTVYLKGKVNRCVDLLLDIEQDSFFTYIRKTQHLDINKHACLEEKRHQRAMLIPLIEVKVIICNRAVQSVIVSLCVCIHHLKKRTTVYLHYITVIYKYLHALIFVM